jgi:hypothetical protein
VFQFTKTPRTRNSVKLTEKGKVKCKIVPLLYYEPKILDVWGSGGIALEVLNLNIIGY